MKGTRLQALMVDELVARFAELGVAQDEALLYDQISKYNRLFKQMAALDQELRARGPEARLALLRLYDHPNMQVRVQAAKKTLGVAPAVARQALEAITASNWFPQAGDAGMCLWFIDTGVFKPD